MKESEIKVFINGIEKFFTTVSEHKVSISTPYLTEPQEVPAHDITGIIGISGERKGCVYITAPRILLHHLLLSLGEQDITEQLLTDIAGEVANTISGNARESFGSGFMISVPIVVKGKPDNIQLPRDVRAFIVPFQWRNYLASLVVCLE